MSACARVFAAALSVFFIPVGVATAAPATDCSATAIAKQHEAFQRAYSAKDIATAARIVEALWNACMTDEDHPPDPVLRAEISNDAALAEHTGGDDDQCLQWLLDYRPAPRTGSAMLDRLPKRLRAAITSTLNLCRPYCATAPGMDASCMTIQASEELDRMMLSDFAERTCPFDTGGSPTLALPDGSCLAAYAPEPFVAQYSEEDVNKVCPRLDRVRLRGGKPVHEVVKLPPRSMLRRISVCCSAINLAIDKIARIEVVPAENPPENCLSGHRYSAQQDVFELRDNALELRFQLDSTSD